jgi:hypothetical protein
MYDFSTGRQALHLQMIPTVQAQKPRDENLPSWELSPIEVWLRENSNRPSGGGSDNENCNGDIVGDDNGTGVKASIEPDLDAGAAYLRKLTPAFMRYDVYTRLPGNHVARLCVHVSEPSA